MDVTLREARDEDAEEVALLLDQLGYPTEAAAVPARLARMHAEGGQHAFVAVVGGKIVGLATVIIRHVLSDDQPFGRLASVVVADAWRSQGIGERLVAEAERICREAGCSAIEVTSGEHRPRAHDFYRRLGYAERRLRFVKRL